MATEVVRYGVSLLDMKYKSDAQNDEVLIRGQDGRLYYKRDDGQIVSHDFDYTKNSLYDNLNNTRWLQKLNTTDFLVYNTIDITGVAKLTSTVTKSLNLGVEFPISKNEDGFYLRIHGNEETNNIVSLAKKIYLKTHTTTAKDVTIIIAIKQGETSSNVTVKVNFNELTFIPVTITEDATISIVSVKMVLVATVLSALSDKEKEIINEINFGNTSLEASCIDLVTFTSDVDTVVVKDDESKVRLNLIGELSDYLAYSVKNNVIPFVISKDKPNFKCIWAQQLTEPETFSDN